MKTRAQQFKRFEKGQIAVFFALSFTFFLILLMMIINMGILTRDRIKIQNTADLAALVGANMQRFQLNRIRELNDLIEDAYKDTEIALLNPLAMAPCVIFNNTCGDTFCELQCNQYQELYNNAWIDAYLSFRGALVAEMYTLIEEGNSNAHNMVMRTALSAQNLPVDVKRELLRQGGGNLPSTEEMVSEYESGGLVNDYGGDGSYESLNEIYEVVTKNQYEPMYLPDANADERTITTFTGIWGLTNCWSSGTWNPSGLCNLGLPLAIPSQQDIPVRVGYEQTITPATVLRVSYSPQFDFNMFSAPFKKGRGYGEKPELIKPPGQQNPARLFDFLLGTQQTSLSSTTRYFMDAWAASRPFGGEPGEDDYEGAKLIGIASRRIGEVSQEFNLSQPVADPGKNIEHEITEEDFLH